MIDTDALERTATLAAPQQGESSFELLATPRIDTNHRYCLKM